MSFVFEDRKSNYPYRYKVTPLSGESYYVYLERADEPTVAGTPLNADTFNTILKEFNLAGVLPTITEADNGKIMKVVDGIWKADALGKDVAILVDTFGDIENIDDTSAESTTTRASCVVFAEGEEYILHSVKVATSESGSVKFVLCSVGSNTITQIEVLGEVMSSNGFAELTFDGGYRVRQRNTVILAIGANATIECHSVASGLHFDDANYYDAENIEIPFTTSQDSALARMSVSINPMVGVLLNEFTKDASLVMMDLDATISEKVDKYVAEALGGDY